MMTWYFSYFPCQIEGHLKCLLVGCLVGFAGSGGGFVAYGWGCRHGGFVAGSFGAGSFGASRAPGGEFACVLGKDFVVEEV